MKFNTAFAQVIRACADSHSAEQGTWITEEMIDGYIAFHEAGFAHSVECYLDQELVGGLYGVAIGKYFAGESMFYSQSNASKLCLLYLIEKLRSQGVTWMDCQQTTPLLLTFGAQNIPRTDFMKILKTALSSDPLVWN